MTDQDDSEQVESLRAEIAQLQDAKRRALAIADAGMKRNADLLAKIARLQRELEAPKRQARRRTPSSDHGDADPAMG